MYQAFHYGDSETMHPADVMCDVIDLVEWADEYQKARSYMTGLSIP